MSMKFTKSFWITLSVTTVLFILPSILTYGYPVADDMGIFYGFPMTFYSAGGFCQYAHCGLPFSYLNLCIDILFVIGLPILIGYLTAKFSSFFKYRQHG